MAEKEIIKYISRVKLDEKDKKILKVLQKDARVPISTISRKTGIQRDSVIYRIKRMQELNVIRFFHTVLNPISLGRPIFMHVNFILHNLEKDEEKKFLSYLGEKPYITYIAKTTGKWDVITNLSAESLEDFDNMLMDIRMKFSKIIKDYNTASIIQEYKYDYFVDLVLKE